jgi:hypothetical protein
VLKKGEPLGKADDDEPWELCISKDEDAGLGANGDDIAAEYLRWSPGNEAERPREWEKLLMGASEIPTAESTDPTGLAG